MMVEPELEISIGTADDLLFPSFLCSRFTSDTGILFINRNRMTPVKRHKAFGSDVRMKGY